MPNVCNYIGQGLSFGTTVPKCPTPVQRVQPVQEPGVGVVLREQYTHLWLADHPADLLGV